ncbi:MAG TPA: hypothetical protein VE621_10750, partial [Bryobacteraceae bacterium]|nr:hypothetical protein [Bryobacteraceae bacterium]
WLQPERVGAFVAIAAALVLAFLAGRHLPKDPEPSVATAPTQIRERVLLVALSDHLERSQMVLAEIMNAPDQKTVDIAGERIIAENLLDANRLYRQTATATGQTGVTSVLEDLERVLAEIAHSPDHLSSAEVDELRRRIESQGLLFKVRVVGSKLQGTGAKSPAASSL